MRVFRSSDAIDEAFVACDGGVDPKHGGDNRCRRGIFVVFQSRSMESHDPRTRLQILKAHYVISLVAN